MKFTPSQTLSMVMHSAARNYVKYRAINAQKPQDDFRQGLQCAAFCMLKAYLKYAPRRMQLKVGEYIRARLARLRENGGVV